MPAEGLGAFCREGREAGFALLRPGLDLISGSHVVGVIA
jgi:hypothetical protein